MKAALNNKEEKNINKYNFSDIKKFLIKKFLYDKDLDCIHILLNIYNIEESIENIYPSYISLKLLKNRIIKFLKYKEGKELIAFNLSQLIHDDVTRFEFYIYLEGYRNGFNDHKNANRLEMLTFKYYDIEELYSLTHLFNYENSKKDVIYIKASLFNAIDKNRKLTKFLKNNIYSYNRFILANKVKNLNKHIDKQIVFNYNSSDSKFVESNSHLTFKELRGLNKELIKFLYKDSLKIYKNAYWDGVNEQVISRYK